jgi:hypothetical protein
LAPDDRYRSRALCVFNFSTSVLTSFGGTTASFAMHDQARGRAGREEGVVEVRGRRNEMKPSTSVSASEAACRQAPNENPTAKQARASVDRLRPVEREAASDNSPVPWSNEPWLATPEVSAAPKSRDARTRSSTGTIWWFIVP